MKNILFAFYLLQKAWTEASRELASCKTETEREALAETLASCWGWEFERYLKDCGYSERVIGWLWDFWHWVHRDYRMPGEC